ncbi:sensor histidine kinase [Alcaligenes faecalis]|uniref:sensor histidine kinase n=1 Tax=Alcaligenes faecalis TaxID=511 RepID=UPI002933AA0E|nr:HAMP domain-containing sensor histidine kinase [Alcaligenes faecalis]MDV2116044.1 HAMP domain-containing sensor histidine kinase [Alcaligenes faecalis]
MNKVPRQHRFLNTLTQRVSWTLTLIATLLVVIMGGLAYVAFAYMEDEMVNAMLISYARSPTLLPDNTPDRSKALGAELDIYWFLPGQTLDSLPEIARVPKPGIYEFNLRSDNWHVLRQDTEQGQLYLLYRTPPHEDRVREFGLILILIGSATILLVFLLSRRVARHTIAPMLTLSRHLENWAPGRSGLPEHQDDEAGRLIRAFNRMQEQVEELLTHEREFAANLGHELRTGLTAIRSDCELLLLQRPEGPQQQRLQRMMVHADAVTASLDAAESLAYTAERHMHEVDIHELAQQTWQAVALLDTDSHKVRWSNLVPNNLLYTLDPYALSMLLRILMRNAIDHAAPCKLQLSWISPSVLTLQDDGPGIAKQDQILIFERHFSQGKQLVNGLREKGHKGIGLALARQLALAQGWSLSVQSEANGKGCMFKLDLDPA